MLFSEKESLVAEYLFAVPSCSTEIDKVDKEYFWFKAREIFISEISISFVGKFALGLALKKRQK